MLTRLANSSTQSPEICPVRRDGLAALPAWPSARLAPRLALRPSAPLVPLRHSHRRSQAPPQAQPPLPLLSPPPAAAQARLQKPQTPCPARTRPRRNSSPSWLPLPSSCCLPAAIRSRPPRPPAPHRSRLLPPLRLACRSAPDPSVPAGLAPVLPLPAAARRLRMRPAALALGPPATARASSRAPARTATALAAAA